MLLCAGSLGIFNIYKVILISVSLSLYHHVTLGLLWVLLVGLDLQVGPLGLSEDLFTDPVSFLSF